MRKGNFEIGEITELPSGRHFSSQELVLAVDSAIAQLRSFGLGSQMKVLLCEKNSASFFIHLFACWELEACVIPLDPNLPAAGKEALVSALSPHFIIETDGNIRSGPAGELCSPGIRLGLLTSGSTGLPKIIWHSSIAIEAKIAALRHAIPIDETRRTLCFLPTFFSHGLICNSLFPLLSGNHLFVTGSFGLGLINELDSLVNKYEIQFFSSTPPIWTMLEQLGSRQNKPGLKRIHCASAPLDRSRIQVMRTWAPDSDFWNVYGLTEFLGWVSGARIDGIRDPGYVGSGWGCQIKLDDLTNEVSLRAPYQLYGQLDWFNTHDIGEIDSSNELILKGRTDFLINKGGLKIQPEEVELIASEFPKVSAVCCFAVPDKFVGHKVALAVVPRRSGEFGDADIEEMRNWLFVRLASYKVPDLFFVLAKLPETNRGKTDRRAVSLLVSGGSF